MASSPPLTTATVAHREHGVRTTFSKVVQWPGLCFLENMLLCPGITVCKAFVSKTRHYALLMFVSYNTGVTFPWFSSDLVSESLEGPSPWAVSYKNVQVARRACQPSESRIILLASRAALCQRGRPLFPWHPGVKGKSMGMTVGPLLQARLQCHRKNRERKSRFQRVRTIHSVTLSGVISNGRAKEYSIFLSLWLKSGQWRRRFEAR